MIFSNLEIICVYLLGYVYIRFMNNVRGAISWKY